MKNFYFTFGCGQLLANHVIVIPADDEDTARSIMFRVFGSKWCGCYTEQQFNRKDNLCASYTQIRPDAEVVNELITQGVGHEERN